MLDDDVEVQPARSGRSSAGPAVKRATPLGDRVYQDLLSRVLSSRMGPGERITIDALGRELGVSQTPIREALHRLAADGIVVHHHLAGYRVAPKLTREQFEHLVEIRLLLEPAAARSASERATPEMIARLGGLSGEMAALLADPDSDRSYAMFSRLDADLHDLVAVCGGNPFIRDALTRLHTHAHLFRLANNALITERAIDEHLAIIVAIQRRDPGEAAFTMRQHIDASAARFRASFTDDDDGAPTAALDPSA